MVEIDHELERIAGGPGTAIGSGGMGSKLAAAKIAVWSGVEAVIADAARPGVLDDGAAGGAGGRNPVPSPRSTPAGPQALDRLRRSAPRGPSWWTTGRAGPWSIGGRSLLPAGVVSTTGEFAIDDAVEIAGPDGAVFAKGLVRHPAAVVATWAGRRSDELPDDVPPEVVHRDDLVVLD